MDSNIKIVIVKLFYWLVLHTGFGIAPGLMPLNLPDENESTVPLPGPMLIHIYSQYFLNSNKIWFQR